MKLPKSSKKIIAVFFVWELLFIGLSIVLKDHFLPPTWLVVANIVLGWSIIIFGFWMFIKGRD